MKFLFIAAMLVSPASARAAQPVKSAARACVKWSKDIPEAQAAGAELFASMARVEGKGPFPACDVVVETESFGVGWLMRAWMKEGVYSSCGKRLGGFDFSYKGDQWQVKLVAGLHQFLAKRPEALAAAKDCPPVPAAAPTVEVSTAPALTP
jgi:hypothetical protein